MRDLKALPTELMQSAKFRICRAVSYSANKLYTPVLYNTHTTVHACRICGTLAMRNANTKGNSDAARRISSLVGSLILLKETLELLPGLGHPLEGAESELLQAIGANCNHEVFHTLLETATEVLDKVCCL